MTASARDNGGVFREGFLEEVAFELMNLDI